MKKLSLMLMFLLGIATVYACGNYYSSSSMNLKLWNNSNFRVVVDGQQYGKTSFFNLNNLTPGNHELIVVKNVQPYHGNGGFKKVLYNGTIHIPNNSKVIATVTPHRNIKVKVMKNHHNNYNSCGNNQFGCNQNYCSQYPTEQCGQVINVMSQYDFNCLKNSMLNSSFDSGRLSIAKQALNHNMLSSVQVRDLMDMFSFESTRLKFAKIAFHQTIDKHRFYVVNEALIFNSSVSNLNNYVNKHI